MTSSRFDLGSTSKTLNLSLLRFNERSGSENLGLDETLNVFAGLGLFKNLQKNYACDFRSVEPNSQLVE